MTARSICALARLEHRATAAGLALAGAALLALLLCAFGLRSAGQMPLDWALLALALSPATRRAAALIAPLFWSPAASAA
jgi:hypothetical protein